MSKSDSNEMSKINLIDSEQLIIKKIMKGVTDSLQGVTYDI